MTTPSYYRSFHNMTLQGEHEGFVPTAQKTSLQLQAGEQDGIYVSDVFDSGIKATEWDELHLQIDGWSTLEIFVWIFDDQRFLAQLKAIHLMDRFYAIMYQGFSAQHEDIILYRDGATAQRGRYLCFAFRTRKQRQRDVIYRGYELSFPSQRFTSYLPAVYRDQPDLEAYSSVFKDLYLHLEQFIDHFHKQLDLSTCDASHVYELLEWVGFDSLKQYAEASQLRGFLTFYWNKKGAVGTLSYYRELCSYLFAQDFHFEIKKQQLLIYTKAVGTTKGRRIENFFHQELPLHIHYKLLFMREAYIDVDAYLNETACLFPKVSRRLNEQHLV